MRFYILDPLRLLAAIMVLIYHYSIYFDAASVPSAASGLARFGYMGVIFFFMLSGFVITASAQNRTAFDFLIARAIRLYPAFIACLMVTLVLVYLLSGSSFSFLSVFANATILNDYLKIPNIDGVYWTLQAELKFYACIFLLISFRIFKYHKYWLVAWLLVAITHFYYKQPFFMGWFINPNYSFYFIGGVSAYLISKNNKDLWSWSIFVVAMFFSMYEAAKQTHDFVRVPSATDLTIASVVVLSFYIFFALLSMGFLNVKKRKGYILAGAISYPIYLLHNKAGKAAIEFFGGIHPSALWVVLTTAMVILIAGVIHIFIEKKIQSLLVNKARNIKFLNS
jgi:peptidoglycan/LPS O-acetylase OafA/YrhL